MIKAENIIGRATSDSIPMGDGTHLVSLDLMPANLTAYKCDPCGQTFYAPKSQA